MKKTLRNTLLILMTVAMLISAFSLSAFALGECRVMVHLVDHTEGEFKDTVTIYYYNEELDITYRAKLDYEDYAFDVKASSNIKNGDYKLTIEYESTDDYEIKNADGSEIPSSFDASEKSHTFEWVIIEKGAVITDNDESSEESTSQDESEKVDLDEGKRLWDAFLDAVEPLKTDTSYSALFKGLEKYDDWYKDATGNDKSEYEEMSSYDKFLWWSTYIQPAVLYKKVKPTNIAKWNGNVVDFPYKQLEYYGTAEMASAYFELMEWNYYYCEANNKVFNFIEDFADYEIDNSEPTDESETSDESTTSVIVPSKNPNKTDDTVSSDSSNDEESDGIWDGVITYIKEHVLTLVILAVLAIATVVVIIFRKKAKNK